MTFILVKFNYIFIKLNVAAAAAKSLQSCLTLRDPIDSSPPGFPVHGILQARILEWVAISFSSAWKWKVKVESLSRVRLLATPWTAAYQAPLPLGFSRQEYWSGLPLPSPDMYAAAAAAAALLQSCPTLCDPIDRSPPGSPVPEILQARTLEWVSISFSNAWKWKVKVICIESSYFPKGWIKFYLYVVKNHSIRVIFSKFINEKNIFLF